MAASLRELLFKSCCSLATAARRFLWRFAFPKISLFFGWNNALSDLTELHSALNKGDSVISPLLSLLVALSQQLVLIIVYLTFGRKDSPFTFDIGGGAPRSGGSDGSAEEPLVRGLSVCNCCWRHVCRAYWQLFGPCSSYRQLTTPSKQRNRTRSTTAAPRGRILNEMAWRLLPTGQNPTVVTSRRCRGATLSCRFLLTSWVCLCWRCAKKSLNTSDGAQALPHGFCRRF